MPTLIKNGLVYDGIHSEPERKDILVKGNTIVGIGSFSKTSIFRQVDASGAYILPGFIDTSSDIDHYFGFSSHELQRRLIECGITSVVAGNFGLSLAPTCKDFFEYLYRPYGDSSFTCNWLSFREFFQEIKKQKLLLNVGTLFGSSNLLHPFLGNEARDLSDSELVACRNLLSVGLKEGAFGLSSEDDASFLFTPLFEEIAEILSSRGRVLSVHVAVRDSSKDVFSKIKRLLQIARKTSVSLQISQVRPSLLSSSEWEGLREMLDTAGSSIEALFDFSLSEFVSLPLYRFLPASFQKTSFDTMLEMIRSPRAKRELLLHLRSFKERDIYLGYVPSHLLPFLGKSLSELSSIFQVSFEEAFLKLMNESRLKAVCLCRDARERDILSLLALSSSSLLSFGGALTLQDSLPASDRFSIQKLRALSDSSGISFGSIISRLTSLPARKFGMAGRGAIKEGSFADLLVVRDDVISRVFVNGRLILQDGVFSSHFSGNGLYPMMR